MLYAWGSDSVDARSGGRSHWWACVAASSGGVDEEINLLEMNFSLTPPLSGRLELRRWWDRSTVESKSTTNPPGWHWRQEMPFCVKSDENLVRKMSLYRVSLQYITFLGIYLPFKACCNFFMTGNLLSLGGFDEKSYKNKSRQSQRKKPDIHSKRSKRHI